MSDPEESASSPSERSFTETGDFTAETANQYWEECEQDFFLEDESLETVFHRANGEAIQDLRQLDGNKLLVLLTPFVSPPLTLPGAAPPMDTFQPLGKALNWHHACVRHLPYVLGLDMTNMHRQYVRLASAVVIAVCETGAELVSRTGKNLWEETTRMATTTSQSLLHQYKFANDTRLYVGEAAIPLIVISIGPSGGMLDHDAGLIDFDNILFCNSFEPVAMEKIADVLFVPAHDPLPTSINSEASFTVQDEQPNRLNQASDCERQDSGDGSRGPASMELGQPRAAVDAPDVGARREKYATYRKQLDRHTENTK